MAGAVAIWMTATADGSRAVVFIAFFTSLETMPPDVLTTTQASAVLGSSRQHVADVADRGDIPAGGLGDPGASGENVLAYRSARREGPKVASTA